MLIPPTSLLRSTNSLSSRDDDDDIDDEVISPVHDEDQESASSTSSPASPSSDNAGDYDPHPSHEIYLAGARKTVLLVADPVDPELRCLAHVTATSTAAKMYLRDEEVLLDLDELRNEVRVLIRLTAKQEEPVARREEEPVGKCQAGFGGVVADGRGKKVRR